MPIRIIYKDITEMEVDAIVNAANTELKNYAPVQGGGVCGAIFRAVGQEHLQAACDKFAPIETSQAVITPGFSLPAKHIIHTVGPIWQGGHDMSNYEGIALSRCYVNCMETAIANGVKTIAFPCISTGINGFPSDLAAKIAIEAVMEFLEDNKEIEEVYFVCFDEQNYKEYVELLNLGNTDGNVINGGFVAQSDGWIYYSNVSYMSGAYRGYDNADDGKLFKIRTDGSDKTKLSDDNCDFIRVVGERIYYRNKSDGDKPYKIHTDGSGRLKLNDNKYNVPVYDSQNVSDWRFYIDYCGNICKRHIDAYGNENDAEIQIVSGDCKCLHISDDWIYYFADDGWICKVWTDGNKKMKLVDLGANHSDCNGICILDDRLVWINEYWFMCEGICLSLESIKIDGTKDNFRF